MTRKSAKNSILALWGLASFGLLALLILRHATGFYGSEAGAIWAWAGQFIFPNITLVIGVWAVQESVEGEKRPVSWTIFLLAITASLIYIAALYIVASGQGNAPVRLTLDQSGWYLGFMQGIVIGLLSYFFVSARR